MAPDVWHHLEGVYSQDGIFRVYLYDDYTKPLAPELAKQVTGRVVLKETFDPGTRTTKELNALPLTMAAGGESLEARVGRMKLPAEMTAKVKFKRDAEEYRFDFAFQDFSVDTGTVARIDRASQLPDNRLFLEARGLRRVLARLEHVGRQYRSLHWEARPARMTLDLSSKGKRPMRALRPLPAVLVLVLFERRVEAGGERAKVPCVNCGQLLHASAPASCAIEHTRAASTIVPTALEAHANATTLVRGPSLAARSS